MARPSTGAATFSVAATQAILNAIDQNAARQGLTRSAYVLQWLPEAQTASSTTTYSIAANGRRKSPALSERLAHARS